MWIVPRPRGAHAVALRLTVTDRQPSRSVRFIVQSGTRRFSVDVDAAWSSFGSGDSTVWWSTQRINGLAPDQRHQIWAELDGRSVGPAMARTLPLELPVAGRGRFSLLLGSCFSYRSDKTGAIGDIPGVLPSAYAPHVKLLCGDQVYIDMPVLERRPRREDRLRALLLGKYTRAWDQGAGPGDRGYGSFLRWGSTMFVSDDHEFWNEYPLPQPQLLGTLTPRGRQRNRRVTRGLFRAFQADYERASSPRTLRTITLGAAGTSGHLEIKVLDGRYFRTRTAAFLKTDLDAVTSWLGGLQRPGVLVIDQPIFERARPGTLTQLDDYGALCLALQRAPHDVLVLTGDIHAGRVARARISQPGRSSTSIYELIASPMALVRPNTGYPGRDAHGTFPVRPIAGATPAAVETLRKVREDHVATIGLAREGDAVIVDIDFWRPRGLPGPRPRGRIQDKSLQLVLR